MWKWIVRAEPAAAASGWKKTPEVIEAIEIILEHDTAGDPITGLKWTRKTTEKIAAFAKQGGGAMTAADLRNYKADWVEPISKEYRGHTVHEIPPNGQGIAALIALGILEHFDITGLHCLGIDAQAKQLLAAVHFNADRSAAGGDLDNGLLHLALHGLVLSLRF